MALSEKNLLTAEFLRLPKKGDLYEFNGVLYDDKTLDFHSDWNKLIFAIRSFLDVDYTSVKDSEILYMYKNILRKMTVADEIGEIFYTLVEAIKEYNEIKF